MQSIFHTKAATAEELRTELLADLRGRIASEETFFNKTGRTTIKERAVLEGRVRLLRDLIQFWTELIINKPPGSSE